MHRLDSTTISGTAKPAKPDKPWPGFPLYAHRSGRWAKKIRGATHYFGPWRDPNGAHQRYLAEKDDLEAGRKPVRASTDASETLTVEGMVGLFLDAAQIKVESGEMEMSTWKAYESFGKRMIRVFGGQDPSREPRPGRLPAAPQRPTRRRTRACRRSTVTSARSRRCSIGPGRVPTVRATSTGCLALAMPSSGLSRVGLGPRTRGAGGTGVYGRANPSPVAATAAAPR